MEMKQTGITVDGRKRVVIEGVKPEVDGGRYAAKRVIGDTMVVEADIFCDGHDRISALLLYRKAGESPWTEVWMEPLGNDHWRGAFQITELHPYEYTLMAWVDHFKTWRSDLQKRHDADKVEEVHLQVGAALVEQAVPYASSTDQPRLKEICKQLTAKSPLPPRVELGLSEDLSLLMSRYAPRDFAQQYENILKVTVDRRQARFSAWYEMFPRSASSEPGKHGTFKDCEARLSYIAEMGFDVLYFPPIHPIGVTNRKGRNNAIKAESSDVGCPWAIGAQDGGHKAILKELGTLEDFRRLVKKAQQYHIEIALDIAFQCSPDHPYVQKHPEWFRKLPDGSIQYAENPPKKYEDIYPFDFECEDWEGLWKELRSVFEFWIEQGVRIFRVDNPHTKPFPFWEWLIGSLKKKQPDLIFLSEAFTRPRIMENLAKLGFTQSYTYFAWRNQKQELAEYFYELTQTEKREYLRPNLWPNTPDILTEYLQTGGRAAFVTRVILAATLGANYGIYGPAFELGENAPRQPGSEEYLDSEKYQLRYWEISRPDSLRELIGLVNRIRKGNPALQEDWNLRIHHVDNDQLFCYSKHSDDYGSVVLVVVNLDPFHTQSGWVDVPVDELGIQNQESYQVHDLLSDARYLWHGPRNYVELNPYVVPAHILRLKRRARTERDFEYFV